MKFEELFSYLEEPKEHVWFTQLELSNVMRKSITDKEIEEIIGKRGFLSGIGLIKPEYDKMFMYKAHRKNDEVRFEIMVSAMGLELIYNDLIYSNVIFKDHVF